MNKNADQEHSSGGRKEKAPRAVATEPKQTGEQDSPNQEETVESSLQASLFLHHSSSSVHYPVHVSGHAPLYFEVREDFELKIKVKTRTLRVVHVGQSMVRAGIESWLKGLARFLDPARVELAGCIATVPEYFDEDLAAELRVPVQVGGRDLIREVARECDALLFWGPRELGEWLSDIPPKLGVFIAHGEGPYTRSILEGCAPVTDHVVAVSRRVNERVCEGFPSTVITHGIDTAHLARSLSQAEARVRFGFRPGDFVLGYVGRFSPEKRPEVVIEAVAGMPEHYKALLVGWGPLHHRLLDLANRLIPGRFALTTATTCLGDYYQAMDALCMTSSEEGFSLVVLEAMMSERPVIATPVGCVPDMIEDRIHGLIIPGTVESVREAAFLLERHPRWARGVADEARRRADEVGHARQMARRYEDLLHSLWDRKYPIREKMPAR